MEGGGEPCRPRSLIGGSFGSAQVPRKAPPTQEQNRTSQSAAMGTGTSSGGEVSTTPVAEDIAGAARSGGRVSSGTAASADALMAEVDARWHTEGPGRDEDGEIICQQCGRSGHACCGQRYWIALRSAWLRTSEEKVEQLPRSFEDAGPLQLARAASTGNTRDLSEGELEDLEDCLDAVQRPFPRLRQSVPLPQAVQCAEGVWEQDD